jgi:hypothetical protein
MGNTVVFSNKELSDFAIELLKSGFRLFRPPTGNSLFNSYFFFSENDKIGYVQWDKFVGLKFSTIHKPHSYVGTGFSLSNDDLPVGNYIEQARYAFCVAPNWFRSDRIKFKKYKDLKEFLDLYLLKDKNNPYVEVCLENDQLVEKEIENESTVRT